MPMVVYYIIDINRTAYIIMLLHRRIRTYFINVIKRQPDLPVDREIYVGSPNILPECNLRVPIKARSKRTLTCRY